MKMKRVLMDNLLSWQIKPGRKPLILQGARQVGKTWLLKQFGDQYFADTAYFNFDLQTDLKSLFQQSKEPKRIIEFLSLASGKQIVAGQTLIVLDEIQECNEALNSLKYFKELAPEYHIAAAGSLLGVALNRGASFPVGAVDFLHMYPLNFSEYLQAADPALFQFLYSIEKIEQVPDLFFNRLNEKLKIYFLTGGMPEAVMHWLQYQDTKELLQIQQNILNAYSLDFSKHADNREVTRIQYIWQSLPSQLARENKKFLYQVVNPGARAREYEDAINWLIHAGLVYKISAISKPGIPLSAYDDLSAFKLYACDVGLLGKMAGLAPSTVVSGNRLFAEFKGALTENYIFQSLMSILENLPRYWRSGNDAEVDLIFQWENTIIPVEIKSNENVRGKSLSVFRKKYQPEISLRFSMQNLKAENGLINIPLFMADRLPDVLKWRLKA